MPAIEITTITAATSALGTLGAFLVALWLLRANLAHRTRDQASRVAAWIESEVRPEDCMVPSGWSLRLRNASSYPVYDCVVSLDSIGLSPEEFLWVGVGTVPPDATRSFPDGADARDGWQVPYYEAARGALSVSFTNSRGRFWTRDPAGHLTRVKRRPEAVPCC